MSLEELCWFDGEIRFDVYLAEVAKYLTHKGITEFTGIHKGDLGKLDSGTFFYWNN